MAFILYSLNIQKCRKAVAMNHNRARMQEALHPSIGPGRCTRFHFVQKWRTATVGWVKARGGLEGSQGPNLGQLGINKECHLLPVRKRG
jgi:hypothetical protein